MAEITDFFTPCLPGAVMLGEGKCIFKVWAPLRKSMILHLLTPEDRKIPMEKDEEGYFSVKVENIKEGVKYYLMPDGEKDFPDPASNYQGEGVHGPSFVVDHEQFRWNDQSWKGLPFRDLVLYELHVGTFTPEGTFEAIIPRIDKLLEAGINALEIMPVTQFPGSRNWGYDGTYPYAIQNSYGGPEGLKRLVDACHKKGMAVFLDVVYNHLGPEGNYFAQFGPYFTKKYCTPWGDALNFDGNYSDGVRDFFCNNALFLIRNYHLDGLRLDAIHMAYDNGAVHFWQELNAKLKDLQHSVGRPVYTIAESDLNSPRTINGPEVGGYGFSSQWLDDFHHSLYVLLDPKGKERYGDFGKMEQLAKAYTDGFVHSGEYVEFRKRKYGASSAGITGEKFVAFNLNHDQVGNRVKGERLCVLVGFERVKLGAAALLLAPYVPMLFMGEEYADNSPFFYFVSHSEPALIEAVRKGRQEEFADFKAEGTPPDPQDEKTFKDSVLKWEQRDKGEHQLILKWHTRLLALRRENETLRNFSKNDIRATVLGQEGLALHRQTPGGRKHLLILFNFSEKPLDYTVPDILPEWKKILDSRDSEWNLNGEAVETMPSFCSPGRVITIQPLSAVVYSGL